MRVLRFTPEERIIEGEEIFAEMSMLERREVSLPAPQLTGTPGAHRP